MTINERIKYIYDEVRKAGVTHQGAIGLLGNLQGETSDFDPMSLETLYRNRFGLTDAEYVRRADAGLAVYLSKTFVYDSAGFGIAQWTWWSRKKGLLELAKSLGMSVGDLTVQVKYMLYEMQTRYTKTWQILTTTNNYEEAVKICVNEYEKPANALQAIQTRCDYAKALLMVIPDVKEEDKKEENLITPTIPSVSLVNFDRTKVIKIALAQVGYQEKRNNSQLDDYTANAGTNNYTKYARDLDGLVGFYNGLKQGYAWCDIFVDWCFVAAYGVEQGQKLLCQKAGGSGAGCTYSMQYFQAKGQFIARNQGRPEVGDQIFFGSGLSNSYHTGLVYAVDSERVYTIEGNTNNSASVVAEGTSVLKKSYILSHSSIIGYGRPIWNDNYIGNGFEINVNDEIKEEENEENVVNTYLILKYGDKGENVKKAQELLILKGYSCGPDGADGDFGNATLAAVNKIRADYKLPSTGIIDDELWEILNGLVEDKPQAQPKEDNVSAPTPSITQFDRQKLLDVALAEVGYYEKQSESQLDDREANGGQKNYTKYARDLDAIANYYYHDRKQGLNWCDIFCDWCFVAAYGINDSFTVNCQPQYSYGAGCPESMAYYKAKGRLDLNPQPGDQFFVSDGMGSTGHTGLVLAVNPDYSITTIEGNQQMIGQAGIDGVVKKTRSISEIAGFGHPMYNDGYGTPEYIGKKEESEIPEIPATPEPPAAPDMDALNILPTLKIGMYNRSVKSLQILLAGYNYNIGSYGADSDFGNDTYNALKAFQQDYNLPTTGECDLLTWNKLLNG